MKLSRFERKLLMALVAVAVMPMFGALFLGQAALREVYEVGANGRVAGQLQDALALYRRHFLSLRQRADDVAHAVASDHALQRALSAADVPALGARLSALCEVYPTLTGLSLVAADGATIAGAGDHDPDPQAYRKLSLTRPLGEVTLELTLVAPAALFEAHQRAGKLTEVFAHLAESRDQIASYYLLVYMALLLVVIAVAVTVGIVLSRRVTRRITLLAEATARVGAGDLQVQVPASTADEISELTQAFNAMVRDIRESRDRIEFLQRLGAWQEFARRLAHEIKNPLTPIQLAVQETHRSYTGPDERFQGQLDDMLSIVEEEVATLRRLVSEFSEFARMPRAQLAPQTLRLFLEESCASLCAIADEYRTEAGDPLAEVSCEVPGEALPVRIDPMLLRRVLDNLVRNAIQALRDANRGSNGPGHVRIGARREASIATIEVADDGPGVPEVMRGRIFDPYVTNKPDGTGLGLSIAKKIVIEHDGELSYAASDAGGAAFTIRLPIRN